MDGFPSDDDSPTIPDLPAVDSGTPPGQSVSSGTHRPDAPPEGWTIGVPLPDHLLRTMEIPRTAVPSAPPRTAASVGRRRALLGVGAVALTTVVVLALGWIIGPKLGGDNAAPTPIPPAPPAPTAAPTPPATSAPPPTQSSAPVSTAAGPATTAGSTGATHPTTPDPKPTPATTSASKSAPANPFGVPERDISCSNGYIVQLASELTPQAFASRVAALRSAGKVPAGAGAADSTKSCKLFTNQKNTLILYSGPYPGPYDGCATRLAGPPDAFIRGANPGTADTFISCICPAKVRSLPTVKDIGYSSPWIGELQRALGHLHYSISDLSAAGWGVYTAGTQDAVRRFQSAHHLPANGQLDRRTWSALHREMC